MTRSKHLYTYIFFAALSLFFTIENKAQIDITLSTQAQIDAFVGTSITGNLLIQESTPGDITDLTPLSSLLSIGGNFEISHVSDLTNLDGLGNITSIGGNVTIAYTSLLADMSGLAGLNTVSGDLIINSNSAINSFAGLENITSVNGSVSILSNSALTDLTGLIGISSIGNNLTIQSNSVLTNLDGFSNLMSVGGDLTINQNPDLTSFCGLYELLNSNGLTGSYSVSANGVNPTEQEIINGGSCTPLPVELTTFNANVNGDNVALYWETATEVNNYGFEIERKNSEGSRSHNTPEIPSGVESWEKIDFISGHGNSNSPKYYAYEDNSIIASGKYLYRLKQIDIDGKYEYSNEIEITIGSPSNYELSPNYPNPFNPETILSFSIPKSGYVSLKVYDVLGNTVSVLENGIKSAGTYSYMFDASRLTSGIYFYTIQAGKFSQTKKMLLVK